MKTVISFNIMNISMVLIRFRVCNYTAWCKKENVFLRCWKVSVSTLICSRHFASLAPDNAPVPVLSIFFLFGSLDSMVYLKSLTFIFNSCIYYTGPNVLLCLNTYSLEYSETKSPDQTTVNCERWLKYTWKWFHFPLLNFPVPIVYLLSLSLFHFIPLMKIAWNNVEQTHSTLFHHHFAEHPSQITNWN